MTAYPYVVFLHIASMVGLFVGYGLEWVGTAQLRKSRTVEQALGGLGLYRKSLPLSGPSLLLLILTGFYLAGVGQMTKEGWVTASLLAIGVALLIGFGLLVPRFRRLRGLLGERTGLLEAAALAKAQDGVTVTLIRIRFFLAMAIVYLMVLKPTFFTSLAVLFAGVIVGILASATAWGRPAAE